MPVWLGSHGRFNCLCSDSPAGGAYQEAYDALKEQFVHLRKAAALNVGANAALSKVRHSLPRGLQISGHFGKGRDLLERNCGKQLVQLQHLRPTLYSLKRCRFGQMPWHVLVVMAAVTSINGNS